MTDINNRKYWEQVAATSYMSCAYTTGKWHFPTLAVSLGLKNPGIYLLRTLHDITALFCVFSMRYYITAG
jgi:hypothetical protein